jgi:hypothetical protein
MRMKETRIEAGSGMRDDQDAAEVEEEQDVRERHEEDLLGQRVASACRWSRSIRSLRS